MSNSMVKVRGSIATCALALLPMVALADKLDVKTGLWESTATTEIAGMENMIPPDVLAKMPPEQRAQMQAMMKGRGAGNPITTQSCITDKDLERGFRPETSKEQSCKVDSTSVHGKTQEAHVTCTGPRGTSTGVFKMTATNRESYDGTMDMNTTVDGRTMSIKMQMKGKWLGADCGKVKPME